MANRLLLLAFPVLLMVACTTSQVPTAPTSHNVESGSLAHVGHGTTSADTAAGGNPNSGAHDDKGYIDGWFNGQRVELYYTKTFFCAEPPDSGASSGCELGADAETAPRPGPIPTIYAIAAAGGIQPPLDTLACAAGTVCLNHPAMIDASRVGGPANGPAVPHSHILSEHAGGWLHTVNIRVRDLNVWNQIAAAKSLDKVRQLQADPIIGVNGQRLISADTVGAMGIYVAGADDPSLTGLGPAGTGMLLMVVAVVLGVRAARNRLPTSAARVDLARDGSVNGELAGGVVMSLLTARDSGIVAVLSNIAHANTSALGLKIGDAFAKQPR